MKQLNSRVPLQIKFESEKENTYGYLGIDEVQVLIGKYILFHS